MLDKVLSLVHKMSLYLQGSTVDLQLSRKYARSVIKTVEDYRSDKEFNSLWSSALSDSQRLGLEPPQLPRQRRPSRRIDTGSSEHHSPNSAEEICRMMYVELLDILKTQLNERFCSGDVEIAEKVQTLLIQSATTEEPDIQMVKDVVQFYDDDFHAPLSGVKAELQLFYNFVKQNSKETLRTVQDLAAFFVNQGCSALFPVVLQLFKILLCIPVTSATAERSFSALKRLKTWLRTRMSDDRLRSLALMSFERELTAELDANINELVTQFADICEQRIPLK